MVESLATDIDETELEGIRNSLFEAAKPLIASIFPDNVITDFDMIRRKMPGKCIALAKDVIKISVFVCGLKSVFPIDIISKPNTYLDLCKKKKETVGVHTASGSNESQDVENDVHKCCNCRKYQAQSEANSRAIVNLDNYVKNIEAIFVAKIQALEKACVRVGVSATQDKSLQDKSPQQKTPQDKPQDHKSTETAPTQDAKNEENTQSLESSESSSILLEADGNTNPASTDQSGSPDVLSESQLRDLLPSELLERADRLSQALRTENGDQRDSTRDTVNNEHESESSSDEEYVTDNQTGAGTDPGYEEDSDEDSDSDVKITKDLRSVGTSPRRVRIQSHGNDAAAKQRNKPSSRKRNNSTASAMSDDGFTTPRNQRKKNKPEKKPETAEKIKFEGKPSPSKRSEFVGKAQKPKVRTNTLFLQNINRSSEVSFKEMADRIKEYGKEKGYDIMYARIYENKFRDDTVSCRIVVPENQSEELIGSGTRAWPKDVTCRRWSEEPPTGRKEQGGQRNSSKNRDFIGSRLKRGRVGTGSGIETSDWESDSEPSVSEQQKRREWYKNFAKYMYAFSNDVKPWNT